MSGTGYVDRLYERIEALSRNDSTPDTDKANSHAVRLTSLDAFRGVVMLLLIPDVYGGFSFYQMARRFPEDTIWSFLARPFTHVQWTGCSIWDLILPAFLFLVGVSMPYSRAARKRRGDSEAEIIGHAVLRAMALLMLGIFLQMPVQTYFDFLWPTLLLVLGLPVPEKLAEILPADRAFAGRALRVLWWTVILCVCAAALVANFSRIEDFAPHDVLSQVGLGYVFAFLLVNRGRVAQGLAAFSILTLCWLAFFLYPLPGAEFDLSKVGVMPGDEIFTGYFAHWNKNTNLAAALDAWFLNLFPRSQPFLFNGLGYQTLNFIPSIATMIFGVMTGEYLRSGRPKVPLRNGLLKAGVLGVLGGLLAGWLLCPIVKSIWTPSWTLFSAGWVLILLAICYSFIDVSGRNSWALPFVVVGRNPILLYVLALKYRWWILEAWRRAFGSATFAGYWEPLIEALAVGLTLWVIAFVLYRLRIFIRL